VAHELLYLPHQSHQTLSIILMGIGVSAAAVIGLRLYLHWRERHSRRAKAMVPSTRKAGRKRRRH